MVALVPFLAPWVMPGRVIRLHEQRGNRAECFRDQEVVQFEFAACRVDMVNAEQPQDTVKGVPAQAH